MDRARTPAVSGSFYPSDANELERLIDECLFTSPLGPQGKGSPVPGIVAGLVPHAGYIYSGPCAAHLYACLDPSIRRVILLGVNHRSRGAPAALSPWNRWQTPLGDVGVDQELNDLLREQMSFLKPDETPHRREHSIEVQLPFLQRTLREFTLLPISFSYLRLEECRELGQVLADYCAADAIRTMILASSDLNHYLSPERTEELDRLAIERVLALDPEGLLDVVENKNISMCGVMPTTVLLFAINALGGKRVRLLRHYHSGQVTQMTEVVGYASMCFES